MTSAPMPIDPAIALYGRPTIIELVQAARDFLADEVLAATEGHIQFHTRVTIRVLDTVVRQLQLGEAATAAHFERLAELGYDSDQALVDAIRAGDHDDGISRLASALLPDVRAKLEVADPRYID